MATVNLYEVLGLSPECTFAEIEKARRRLAKIFHPDKTDGNPELYELITQAYTTLIDPAKRSDYDEVFKLSKQSDSDHFKLKNAADEFFKAQELTNNEKSKKEAEKDFEKLFAEMDHKNKFQRTEIKSVLNTKETEVKINDLKLTRDQEDIESIHDNVFKGKKFDLSKFNALYDMEHKTHGELIEHTGAPAAFDASVGLSFSSLDAYDSIYDKTEEVPLNSFYSSVKLDNSKKKTGKIDINNLPASTYTTNHNKMDDEYSKQLAEKVKARQNDDDLYSNRSMNDFKTDDAMGGYGIFNNIGVKAQEIAWENEQADLRKRYNKLLQMRNSGTT